MEVVGIRRNSRQETRIKDLIFTDIAGATFSTDEEMDTGDLSPFLLPDSLFSFLNPPL